MAAQRNRPHILVPTAPHVESYRSHPRKITPKPVPPSSIADARRLATSLRNAVGQAEAQRAGLDVTIAGAQPGTYVQFRGKPGIRLELQSLHNETQRVQLVGCRREVATADSSGFIEQAAVFVPPHKGDYFTKKFDDFVAASEKPHDGRPNRKLVDTVSDAHLAALEDLWTDPIDQYPGDDEVTWWEIWLMRSDADHPLEQWMTFADHQQFKVDRHRLEFDDRVVTLAKASARQLAPALAVLGSVAELRNAKNVASFFMDQTSIEQADWGRDLLERSSSPPADAPAVCILDTGVNYAHPLLEGILDPNDCHACDPTWRKDDHHGHGTQMAGVAAYGDLADALAADVPWRIGNLLESVTILPLSGENDPELYAAITAEATSRVEVQAPRRARTFLMAVTADGETDRGQPTSWSAAIDALSAGRTFDPQHSRLVYLDEGDEESAARSRLFVLSAGNVARPELAHMDRCDAEPVQDPAQAWNALTVGAYTDKVYIDDPDWGDWSPVASAGDLSPWTTTSMTFGDDWPLKPDVVAEGGNAAHDGDSELVSRADLSLLTTNYKPNLKLFVDACGTSPAAAQVARIAASTMARYPSLWPETIRALVVHSAEWTQAMRAEISAHSGKKRRARLLRRYGFGVPSLERAVHSAEDALTLVAQRTLQPFDGGSLGEMHLHELPWPRAELERLGAALVELRVTLSYFIEPNPGRRGWNRRFQYASHGLRFDLNEPNETPETLRKRVNKKALAGDEERPKRASSATDWLFGEARNLGSLHGDALQTTAAELAERNAIAIYPVGGWWKFQRKRDRSAGGVRYALVVSLKTEATEVDLWTPVANSVGVPTTIEIGT